MGPRFPVLAPKPHGNAQVTKVEVTWMPVTFDSWNWTRVLYLYQNPDGSIYYIGKAYDCSVAERRKSHANEGLITLVPTHNPSTCQIVMVGIPVIQAGQGLLTDSLINDVEALLIRDTRPARNIVKATISRALEVSCTGTWPHWQKTFCYATLPPIPSGSYGARL